MNTMYAYFDWAEILLKAIGALLLGTMAASLHQEAYMILYHLGMLPNELVADGNNDISTLSKQPPRTVPMNGMKSAKRNSQPQTTSNRTASPYESAPEHQTQSLHSTSNVDFPANIDTEPHHPFTSRDTAMISLS